MAFNRQPQEAPPQQQEQPQEQPKGNRPVHTVSLPAGKGAQIVAAVFENQVQSGESSFTSYSISIQRRYNSGGQWKTANGFRENDLLTVAAVAQKVLWDIRDSNGQSQE